MTHDPLCLTDRSLEACRPAAERAEERVPEAAVECLAPPQNAGAGCTTCHRGAGCWDLDCRVANELHGRKATRPAIGAGQRPQGQAAVAVAFAAAAGWR